MDNVKLNSRIINEVKRMSETDMYKIVIEHKQNGSCEITGEYFESMLRPTVIRINQQGKLKVISNAYDGLSKVGKKMMLRK